MNDDPSRLIELLPQAPPFRFVDALTEWTSGQSAEGQVTFPPGHRVFEGHLPDRPLVPGVIVLEALAQLCGLVLIPEEGGQPVMGYLADVSRLRYRRVVHPGETITLRSELDRQLGSAARFRVAARVGDDPVAEGLITVGGMSVPRPPDPAAG